MGMRLLHTRPQLLCDQLSSLVTQVWMRPYYTAVFTPTCTGGH